MMDKFKMEKFSKNDSGTIQIHWEVLPSGKVIAFGIALTDLATLRFSERIDFDGESDAVIEKYQSSEKNLAFEYIPNIGFTEKNINQQTWFVFR